MDLDILERVRAGDHSAYAGLISTWGERVIRAAALLAGRDHAEQVAAATFVDLWPRLAAMHSERPFRPELMRALLDAATAHDPDPAAEASPVQRTLATLDEDARGIVVQHLYAGMAGTEIMLVRREMLGKTAKAMRRALRAMTDAVRANDLAPDEDALRTALAGDVASVELPAWFAEETVLPAVTEPQGPEVRRLISTGVRETWAALLDPNVLASWGPADARLRGTPLIEPGSRIVASGSLGGTRSSRDETLITRVEGERVLAWTTRTQLRPWSSAIELRWIIELTPQADGCGVTHRLRGVAFPGGFSGRALRAAWLRAADAIPHSMHAGMERLATAIVSRTGPASL